MAETQEQSVEVDAKEGRFKVSGSNILNLLTFVMVVLLCYGGFMHEVSAGKESETLAAAIKDSAKSQSDAIRESTATLKAMLDAQRETNCLSRLAPEQKKRFDEIQFCKQLGQGR